MNRDWPEALDQAAARGERKEAWRKKRLSQLECGDDVEALATTIDEGDVSEWHLEFAALLVTATADQKLLKIHEIKRRLVDLTIERESESWRDE